jgi:heparosan-N-sulfate-glucuronate 5-epimerase
VIKKFAKRSDIKKRLNKLLKRTFIVLLMSCCLLVLFILFEEISAIPRLQEATMRINLKDPFLNGYCITYMNKYPAKRTIFDGNGIPLIVRDGKVFYNPVKISQFALGAYFFYLRTGNDQARQSFLKCAKWLEANLKKYGKFYYWGYYFEIDYPGIKSMPYFSAMAQGQGASVLLRAYVETNDKSYLHAAQKAIQPIFHDMSAGGISVIRNNNYVFPQELSTIPASDILNGAISSYIGVYEYWKITGNRGAETFSKIMVRTFSEVLAQYDAGFWSFYSKWPRYLADPHYNARHVLQLRLLYEITKERKFLTYSEKFREYQNNSFDRIRYIISNHIRQIIHWRLKDFSKIPIFFKRVFLNS